MQSLILYLVLNSKTPLQALDIGNQSSLSFKKTIIASGISGTESFSVVRLNSPDLQSLSLSLLELGDYVEAVYETTADLKKSWDGY